MPLNLSRRKAGRLTIIDHCLSLYMLFDSVSLHNVHSNLYFSFEGLIFFVYDREAVKKEADPPENAIIYFYPPSVNDEFLRIRFESMHNVRLK